jgi:hypothetical protein
LDAALKAALSQQSILLFGAVKIELPDYTLRLLDGSGVVVIDGETYVGEDPNFGTIATISGLDEEIGGSAPEITVTINPPNLAATAALSNSNMQGAVAHLVAGAIDRVSGLVIGQPVTLFLGEVDVPTISIDQNGGRTLEYSLVSGNERLFEVEEGQRASNGWLQSIRDGDLGLEFMTGTDVNLYWGAKPAAGSIAKKGNSPASGGSSNLRAR